MARKTLSNGTTTLPTTWETETRTRFSIRTDGNILRQVRIDGRLEGATIVAKANSLDDLGGVLQRFAARRGASYRFGA